MSYVEKESKYNNAVFVLQCLMCGIVVFINMNQVHLHRVPTQNKI